MLYIYNVKVNAGYELPKCCNIFEELDLDEKSSNAIVPISSATRNNGVYHVQVEQDGK